MLLVSRDSQQECGCCGWRQFLSVDGTPSITHGTKKRGVEVNMKNYMDMYTYKSCMYITMNTYLYCHWFLTCTYERVIILIFLQRPDAEPLLLVVVIIKTDKSFATV